MKTEQFYNHTRISDQTNNVKKLSIDEKVNKKASHMELQKSEDTEFCFSRSQAERIMQTISQNSQQVSFSAVHR